MAEDELREDSSEIRVEKEQEAPMIEGLLLPRDTLLSAGIHIGTRMKTRDMPPNF
jgi:hypothetical protein